ncbi:ABC transporter substrate-binding protein [Cellulomonas timonensis]|uniref:ABC transporter substrate-binding protein n=1 Tax=Cellulomonas timonensis TaxID=1689271 RepID=UPI00082E0D35|nr:extracellular solute-binding protein [Cellulomonas timonensis]
MSLPTSPRRLARPGVRLAAVTVAAALALAACAGSDDPGSTPSATEAADEEVTIRFSWWGSDSRHALTQQVIDAFEAQHPNITVEPDFTTWDGYWDKLSTSIAGGDAPDVITQEERYLRDYGTRGVLLDLAEVEDTLDLSGIDPSVAESGSFDGATYGVATGVNAYVVLADPQAFADAGVEMPDDTTWTWDDYVEIATKISQASGGTVYGTQDFGFNEPGFSIYARQHGQSLYKEDGTLGYKDSLMADWWKISLALQESGGQPEASRSVEIDGAGPEGSLLGTNTGAMGVWWTNQLGAISKASGRQLEILRFPGESEGKRTGMYFKPAMYYSVAKTSEHPEAAALFIDFLVNSTEAGQLLLSDRGLPANLDVRKAVQPSFADADKQAAEFLEGLSADVVDGVAVPPVGAGEVVPLIKRVNGEVLFGQITPEEAAAKFTAEVTTATQK